ncbi:MAG: bifunctional precorrin-2 dehydrogenase/sirohydrochlorin ferrochelatase [Ignavibacteriaceae bacterium]
MKKSVNSTFYPILVNLERFPCLIIGGGKVAYRKVLSLQEFNANITIISPKICKALSELAEKNNIRIIKRSYSKEIIKDYKIIFSATDNPEINKMVRTDCSNEGILLNVVDNPVFCDFILPANIKRGDLTISVSSQGSAPFYTKEIKKKIDEFISPVYSDIIEMAAKFRKQLLAGNKCKSAQTKAKMFRRFTSVDWEKILTENGEKSSVHYINKLFRESDLH